MLSQCRSAVERPPLWRGEQPFGIRAWIAVVRVTLRRPCLPECRRKASVPLSVARQHTRMVGTVLLTASSATAERNHD